jgi:PAS domain S-box-containing protein
MRLRLRILEISLYLLVVVVVVVSVLFHRFRSDEIRDRFGSKITTLSDSSAIGSVKISSLKINSTIMDHFYSHQVRSKSELLYLLYHLSQIVSNRGSIESLDQLKSQLEREIGEKVVDQLWFNLFLIQLDPLKVVDNISGRDINLDRLKTFSTDDRLYRESDYYIKTVEGSNYLIGGFINYLSKSNEESIFKSVEEELNNLPLKDIFICNKDGQIIYSKDKIYSSTYIQDFRYFSGKRIFTFLNNSSCSDTTLIYRRDSLEGESIEKLISIDKIKGTPYFLIVLKRFNFSVDLDQLTYSNLYQYLVLLLLIIILSIIFFVRVTIKGVIKSDIDKLYTQVKRDQKEGDFFFTTFHSVLEKIVSLVEEKGRVNSGYKDEFEMLERFFQSSGDFLLIKSLDGRYLKANKRFLDLIEMDMEKIQGKKPLEIGYSLDFSKLKSSVEKRVVETKSPEISLTKATFAGVFGMTWLEEKNFPILDSNGKVVYVGVISRDISSYKKSENQLNDKLDQLKKENKELKKNQKIIVEQEKLASIGILLSGIAHEINNPLQVISLSAEPLKMNLEDLVDESSRDEKEFIKNESLMLLDSITKSCNRIDEIVKSTKRQSHPSSKREDISLNLIMNDVISMIGAKLKGKVTLYELYQDDLPLINVMRSDLSRAIINIILNGIDAVVSRHGEIDGFIIVETRYDKHSDIVTMKIVDNGTGIESKVIDHIFDPFFTTKPMGVGSGLGLHIAYKIVNSNGGQIKVKTTLNEGSCFKLSFKRSG